MNDPEADSGRDGWARLRFAIVGPLLAAPPERGALRGELARLAAHSWRHPITRAPISFAFPTIERWYYAARKATRDPVGVLRHRRRKDAGQQRTLSARLELLVQDQYQTGSCRAYGGVIQSGNTSWITTALKTEADTLLPRSPVQGRRV